MEEQVATVAVLEDFADGVRRIELDAPGVGPFHAGQFVSVRVGAGYHPRRSYSVASAPGAARIELWIQNVGGTAATFIDGLRLGAQVRFNGPMGFFVVADHHPGDVVLAATGVAGGPVLAMAEQLVARATGERVELFWGMRAAPPAPAQARVRALIEAGVAAHVRVSGAAAPGLPAYMGAGRITGEVLATAARLREPTYYLCGNGDMIDEVIAGLHARGVGDARIHTEVFYPRVGPPA
ncbi:MAG TPA: FAD-binding oxidoreductase [Kofleriaceae bacterium]|nr:FAD-binding oxidoreductase [Kofleriaceae bacterium]